MMLNDTQRGEPAFNVLSVLGRLVPGAGIEQANAEMQVLWQAFLQRVAAAVPEKDRPRFLQQRAAVLRGANGLELMGFRGNYAAALLVLMGIVALVLLLACANLSSLSLARAASRQREISVRLAIGAGRGRLLRQFLTESFALAALGGCAGLLLARWFSSALVSMIVSGDDTLVLSSDPDWRVLAFTGAISLAACILAGLAAGVHAVRADPNPGLRQTPTGGDRRLRQAVGSAPMCNRDCAFARGALF